MKIGILGSGEVAQSLGSGFLAHRHQPMLGTRDQAKLSDWVARNPGGAVGSPSDAAVFGELLVLAVKGAAAADALRGAGVANLEGKIVIDATNPIADAPPKNGVLKFFTNLDESLMERLQREFAGPRFVKAFNSVGSACMVDPKFKGGRPTMFICGDDEKAKDGRRDSRGVRLGDGGHGRSRGGASHRAAVHALVHSGLLAPGLVARVQAVELTPESTWRGIPHDERPTAVDRVRSDDAR